MVSPHLSARRSGVPSGKLNHLRAKVEQRAWGKRNKRSARNTVREGNSLEMPSGAKQPHNASENAHSPPEPPRHASLRGVQKPKQRHAKACATLQKHARKRVVGDAKASGRPLASVLQQGRCCMLVSKLLTQPLRQSKHKQSEDPRVAGGKLFLNRQLSSLCRGRSLLRVFGCDNAAGWRAITA